MTTPAPAPEPTPAELLADAAALQAQLDAARKRLAQSQLPTLEALETLIASDGDLGRAIAQLATLAGDIQPGQLRTVVDNTVQHLGWMRAPLEAALKEARG